MAVRLCNSLLVLIVSLISNDVRADVDNDRPIVGVLTQPLNVEMSGFGAAPSKENRTFIAASYVKFAESAGARVVPIHYDAPNAELVKLFRQINGIILPGGGTSIKKIPRSRYREAGELLLDLSLKTNDKGDPFPIHGTCLGFQLLSLLVADDDEVLCANCYDTSGTPMPLNLAPGANESKLFSSMPASLIAAATTRNITENSHVSGVEPMKFKDNKRLNTFFRVLSTNVDDRGKAFVSTIEAKQYPITATQWHPEKNNFEWGKIGTLGFEAIPHSADAVLLSQFMANQFVNWARKSSHRFETPEAEQEALIYNYAAIPDPQGYYSQVYLWENGRPVGHSIIV